MFPAASVCARILVEPGEPNTWSAVNIKSTGTCKDTGEEPIKIPQSSVYFSTKVIAFSNEPSDKSAPVAVLLWLPALTVG